MRILIVDDEAIALDVLEHALTHAGHQVETARDGAEALETLRGGSCRLVISDWEMPRMDGLELCRRVRGEDAFVEHEEAFIAVRDQFAGAELAAV